MWQLWILAEWIKECSRFFFCSSDIFIFMFAYMYILDEMCLRFCAWNNLNSDDLFDGNKLACLLNHPPARPFASFVSIRCFYTHANELGWYVLAVWIRFLWNVSRAKEKIYQWDGSFAHHAPQTHTHIIIIMGQQRNTSLTNNLLLSQFENCGRKLLANIILSTCNRSTQTYFGTILPSLWLSIKCEYGIFTTHTHTCMNTFWW